MVGLLLLGAGLRLFWLGHKSLWLDEAFSLWVARRPPGELWGWLIRIDQHPPLYYAALALWRLGAGDGEAALRLLSALTGIAAIPALFLATDRLLDRPTARLSALLLAISPFQIAYAQEVRMYAPLALFAVLAFLALATLHQGGWPSLGKRPGLWIGLILAQAAALWTHNTALFLPIALTGAALALGAPWRRWLAAQLGVLILWLPWLPGLLAQVRSVTNGFWIAAPTAETLFWAVADFGTAYVPDWLPPRPVWAGLVIGLACFGAVHMARTAKHRPALLALLSLLLTPVVGMLLASVIQPIFLNRSLIWAGLPYLVLLAWGIRHLPWLSVRWGAWFGLLAVTGICLFNYYLYVPKENWRGAAAIVAERVRPGEVILFNAGWTQLPFDYYFRENEANSSIEGRGVPADLFERGELEPAMTPADTARLSDLIQDRSGVWLIYSHEGYTDPSGLIVRHLFGQMAPAGEWRTTAVRIFHFVPR